MRRVSKQINKSRRRVSKRIQKSRRKSRQERQDKNRKTRKQMKRSKRKKTRRVSKRKIRSKSKSKYIEGGGPWWSCFSKPKKEQDIPKGGKKYVERVERAKEAWTAETQEPGTLLPPSSSSIVDDSTESADVDLGIPDSRQLATADKGGDRKEAEETLKIILSLGVSLEDLKGSGVDTEKYLRDEEAARDLCEIRDRESESTLKLLDKYTQTGEHLNNRILFRKLNLKKKLDENGFCSHPLTLYRQLDTLLPTMRDGTLTSDMTCVNALEYYGSGGKEGQMVTWIEAYRKCVDISVRMHHYESVLFGVYTTDKGALYLGERLHKQYQGEALMHPTEWEDFLERYSLLRKRKKQVAQSLAFKFDEMKTNFSSARRKDFQVARVEYRYNKLEEIFGNNDYKRFVTKNKTVNSQISEAVFHNLRVKYPHLVSSSQREQNSFLERQKEIRDEKVKQEQSENAEQKRINEAWIAVRHPLHMSHGTHRYIFTNTITGDKLPYPPSGKGVKISYRGGASRADV